jgi:hypothetical protein
MTKDAQRQRLVSPWSSCHQFHTSRGSEVNALAKTGSPFLYLSNLREKLLPTLFQRVDTSGRTVQKRNLGWRWVGHEAETVCRNNILETMVRGLELIAPPPLYPYMRAVDLLATPIMHGAVAMRKVGRKSKVSRLDSQHTGCGAHVHRAGAIVIVGGVFALRRTTLAPTTRVEHGGHATDGIIAHGSRDRSEVRCEKAGPAALQCT